MSDLIHHLGMWTHNGRYGEQDAEVIREVMIGNCYRFPRDTVSDPHEVMIDIGSHIGCFSVMWHRRNPLSKIICVEACPENIPALMANVGEFATVIHAACTYETEPVGLLNTIKPGGTATGGSTVYTRQSIESGIDLISIYRADLRPLPKITIEQIIERCQIDHIDVLKLDCEKSEFSILEHSTAALNARLILGEYHGRIRWDELVHRRFSNWKKEHRHSGDIGQFWLTNPEVI